MKDNISQTRNTGTLMPPCVCVCVCVCDKVKPKEIAKHLEMNHNP